MTSTVGRLLVIGLVLVTLISLWRTVAVEGEKRRLAKVAEEVRQHVQQLEAERTALNTELANAKRTVEGQTGDLANYRQELEQAQQRLQHAAMELASLKHEQEALLARNSTLANELTTATTQKQVLEAKLSDLHELRAAIHDVKRKVWEQRWAAWRMRLQAEREADQQRLASGNRGYVLRNGSSTIGAAPRLHVHVLEPQAQ